MCVNVDADMAMVRKKLVVVGDGACGKTSLLSAFLDNQFTDIFIRPVLETCTSEIAIDGRTVTPTYFAH